MSKDNGGPAFPVPGHTESGFPCADYNGMSLRDWFAGLALQRMELNAPAVTQAERDIVAKVQASFAYQMADAMLAEREKQ